MSSAIFACFVHATSYMYMIIHSGDVISDKANAMIVQISAIIVKVFAKCKHYIQLPEHIFFSLQMVSTTYRAITCCDDGYSACSTPTCSHIIDRQLEQR